MNIPKSYEALAADLASEKIISKTLQGQKESYMMLADGRKFDLDAIQQRLTVAEKRADLLEGLLKSGSSPTYAHCSAVMEALKPAAEPTIEAARQSLSFENQRIQPARFHCLACGEHHEGSGSLPCPKMKPMSGAKP